MSRLSNGAADASAVKSTANGATMADGAGRPEAGAIVQVTLWCSPYLGNFMSSELALARQTRAEFGLGTHFVLGPGAEGQPWLADLQAIGATWSVLPRERSQWRAHLDKVIAEHDARLVHAHFTAADLMAAAAASAVGVPCVWHIHTGFNGYPLRRRAKDLYKMRYAARRQVARIIAVSPWLAKFAERRGAPRDRIVTIPNAIVLERFQQLPERAAARRRIGVGADAEVVLGFGWWPEVKGVDVLVDAAQQIAQRRSAPTVLLVGEERMRSFLRQRLPEAPPWLRVSGFISDPAWLFAAADVFVSASRHEGQSSAIGEALACGLPVVMSDIPGTAGWGEAPYVPTFPSEDGGALAARLQQLLESSPQRRAEVGIENREWARAHLEIDHWCEQVCAVYRSLL